MAQNVVDAHRTWKGLLAALLDDPLVALFNYLFDAAARFALETGPLDARVGNVGRLFVAVNVIVFGDCWCLCGGSCIIVCVLRCSSGAYRSDHGRLFDQMDNLLEMEKQAVFMNYSIL